MKFLILIAAVVAAVVIYRRCAQHPGPQTAGLQAPQKYAKSLADDEKRAVDAAAKANAAIKQETQSAGQVLEEAEKK